MPFPASPSDNDVHKENNRSFVWDNTLEVWDQLRDAPDTISILGSDKGLDNVTLGSSVTGTLGSSVVFPAGHIIRSFYDESDAELQTFNSETTTVWAEMELTITGGGLALDFLQVTVNINGIYNGAASEGVFFIGVAYSDATGASFGLGETFGTVEFVTRTGYTTTTDGLNIDSTIVIRAAHPSTSTYYVRPRIKTVTSAFNVNQGGGISTITAHEIKG